MNKKKEEKNKSKTSYNLIVIICSLIGIFGGIFYVKQIRISKDQVKNIIISNDNFTKTLIDFSEKFNCPKYKEKEMQKFIEDKIIEFQTEK